MDEVVISMGDGGLHWTGDIDLEKAKEKAGHWGCEELVGEEDVDGSSEEGKRKQGKL